MPHGNASALAIGALLDGIPEAIVIGVSMLEGGAVSLVAVTAIFLSNVPEGAVTGFLAAFALSKLT